MTNIKLLESNIYLLKTMGQVLVHLDPRIKLILHDPCQLHITLQFYVDYFCLFLLFHIGRSRTASKLIHQNNFILINKRNKTFTNF